jgi:metal-responsive CopG/Arc/MetJ family transcriptional regulator
MASKMKNVTFTLPIDLIDKLKEYAQDNYIPSLNSGVKEALEEYTTKLEKEKLKREMQQASKDKLFMKDLMESQKDFESLDDELSRGTNEW